MVTPDDILKKAQAKYLSFLSFEFGSREKSFFPLEIRCDKKTDFSSLKELDMMITQLQAASVEKKRYGYTISYVEKNTRLFGRQHLPDMISFDSKENFLKYIGKEEDTKILGEIIDLTIGEFPDLREVLVKHHALVVKYYKDWNAVLKVCRFFRNFPKPDKFVRELQIGVHTKFVEEHKDILRPLLDVVVGEAVNEQGTSFFARFNLKEGDPLISFRVLDPLLAEKYLSGYTYNTVFVCEFAKSILPVKRVIIVENKYNLMKIIELIPQMRDTLVVWGCGYKVTVLRDVPWLDEVELYYWGDMDAHGYEILSNVRKHFPKIESIMMDKAAMDVHPVRVDGKESPVTHLLNLTPEEEEVYEWVRQHTYRYEQEYLPEDYVTKCLSSITDEKEQE